MDLPGLQTRLSAKFETDEVKQREGGFNKKLDYIPIDKVINRLNAVLPMGYSWTVKDVGEMGGSVIVTGCLEIVTQQGFPPVIRYGVGADKIGTDMDKAVKTAYAEAFKKACNTLGVGLYLWDEDEREELKRDRMNQDSKREFTPKQLETMKFIRTTLKLSTDDLVNEFLKNTYPDEKVNCKKDLNPGNIDAFLTWAKSTQIK